MVVELRDNGLVKAEASLGNEKDVGKANSNEKGKAEVKKACPACSSEDVESHEFRTVSSSSGEGGIVTVGDVPIHCRVCLACGWLGDLHVTSRGTEVLREKRDAHLAKLDKEQAKAEHDGAHKEGLLGHLLHKHDK